MQTYCKLDGLTLSFELPEFITIKNFERALNVAFKGIFTVQHDWRVRRHENRYFVDLMAADQFETANDSVEVFILYEAKLKNIPLESLNITVNAERLRLLDAINKILPDEINEEIRKTTSS